MNEYFDSRVIVSKSGCWEWQKALNPNGYGKAYFNGKLRQSHRISWILHRGKIPVGLFVLHHCDNPICVNPDHLFLGTQKDNMHDMIAKGRKNGGWHYRTHCLKGHEYTLENTHVNDKGHRYCRACGREFARKYRKIRSLTREKKPLKKFCKNGHEFTGDNTHINTNGHRVCRTCGRQRKRKAEGWNARILP